MVFPWYFGTILGCMCLASLTGWLAGLELSFRNFLITGGPILLVNLFFWYGFFHCRSYLTCYILGNAGTIIAGILVSCFFKNEPISILTVVGAILAITGAATVAISLK